MRRALAVRTGTWAFAALVAAMAAGCDEDASSGAGSDGAGADGAGAAAEGGAGGGSPQPFHGAQSCAELGGAEPLDGFPGIDASLFSDGSAPAGCELAAATPEAISITLTPGATRISFDADTLRINGVACSAADGAPIALTEDTQITITGTPDDDVLMIDLAEGHGGSLAATSTTGLLADLGGGTNRLILKGSSGADATAAGTEGGALRLDTDGDGEAEIAVAGVGIATASLGEGDDRFDASLAGWGRVGVNITICGAEGADDLRGGDGLDRIEGGPGDDTLRAAASADGSDYLDGEDGFDTATYAERTVSVGVSLDGQMNDGEADESDNVLSTVESVVGGDADDTLQGTARDERFDGGPGNDTIDGGEGQDVLLGGDGDDLFPAGSAPDGRDLINGGPGLDAISYAQRTTSITATTCASSQNDGCDAPTCACEANDGEGDELDTLVNVEGVHGGSAADTLIGDDADNSFYANGGDDLIDGRGGDDSLFGDDGDDVLIGAEGDDYLDGAADMDQYDAGSGEGDICVVDISEAAINCELF